MKKSFEKKLSLKKITVVNLQAEDMQKAAGGRTDTIYPAKTCISSSFIACVSACVTACPTESGVICCL